jgi:hypothetical protein
MKFDDVKTQYLIVLAVSFVFALSGCSISNGAGSASDSSGSSANSSGSSAGSSGGGSKTASLDNRYESDVQDYTVSYLRSNASKADQQDFMKGISDVAAQNGIVDWEAHPRTYRVIGQGLKQANISGTQYEVYKNQLASGNMSKMDDIQRGYEN